MKICYIAPVISFATQEAVGILKNVSGIIYKAGFGICGAVAFIEIFRATVKYGGNGDKVALLKTIGRCAVGILMLIALPHIVALIDAMFDFVSLGFIY
ncbi:MAG: hypothetical protein ACRC1P_09910 [Cellulosilyticaceae bacterium]